MHQSSGLIVLLTALLLSAPAAAQSIQVTHSGDDLVLAYPSVFQLRFDKSQGGNITRYYDLAHDPGASTNLAAAGGSLYDGLYFIMFKQESPEMWTANFRASAQSIEVIDAQPEKVKVRVRGDFPDGGFGLPASFEVFYTITAAAKIYIRSRVTFNQAYANDMQIRQALGLTTSYATADGWTEFSQDQDLTPFYYYGGGDDDYLGARIDKPSAKVDPVLILHSDWSIADYVLLIAPNEANECLIAWVSNGYHAFSAGEVMENKFLLLMNQFNTSSHGGPGSAAAAYRAGNGGDFGDQAGAPEAVAIAEPASGIAPLVVSFDASDSQDSDGVITTYEWDFGDGATGSGVTTSHTYDYPDAYQATLTVTDDTDLSDTAQVDVYVEGPRVIIDNSDDAPSFTSQGEWPTFDTRPGFYGPDYALNEVGTGGDWARWQPELAKSGPYRVFASWSTDVDRPTDAGFAIHHRDGVQSVLVDMRVTDESGWNVLGEFDFEAAGNPYVELTDDAPSGAEVVADAVMFEYLGQNKAPNAELLADPVVGLAPLEVEFDGSESTDDDGSIADYHWDFDDGETATGATVSHLFTAVGTYEVSLTVIDDAGASNTTSTTIQAQDVGAVDADAYSGSEDGCSCATVGSLGRPWSAAVLLLLLSLACFVGRRSGVELS